MNDLYCLSNHAACLVLFPVIQGTHTFAAEMLFEHGRGDMSRKISSPSVKPRPKVGTGGEQRPGLSGEELLGTSDAAFGEGATALFVVGLAVIAAPPEFCRTLRKNTKSVQHI